MSLSTPEAEYCAASDAAAEARGLSNLLTELGYAPCLLVKIHTDNKGAQAIIENNASRQRTRYIDMKYHWISTVWDIVLFHVLLPFSIILILG